MLSRVRIVVLALSLTAALSFAAGTAWARNGARADLESRIYHTSDAHRTTGAWGWIDMFADGATTAGTDSMLVAELVFLPGKNLHPAHRHPNEEFQYIVEGSGTWSLNGQDSPAVKGDVMYAKPGDMHGLTNTSNAPLRFFVVKWVSKGGPHTIIAPDSGR
jgi:quercetin dioxygenase-like cupin family protein